MIGIHTSLTFMTGRPEFLLDTEARSFDGKTESEFLAKSITDVSAHYKVEWLDQKSIDWANLIQCLAIVYGGRIYAIRSTPRQRAASSAPPAGRAGNPASIHVSDGPTRPPANEYVPRQPDKQAAPNVGEIAGVGGIVFPDDHPLSPNQKKIVN